MDKLYIKTLISQGNEQLEFGRDYVHKVYGCSLPMGDDDLREWIKELKKQL